MALTRGDLAKLVDAPADPSTVDVYDIVMYTVIVLSIIPLAFRSHLRAFDIIEVIATIVFVIDYILRWVTADLLGSHEGRRAFLLYPFSPMAIVDLLSLIPGFALIFGGFSVFRSVRVLRLFKIFRLGKVLRYSHSARTIMRIIRYQRRPLAIVCCVAVMYVLFVALIMFNVEPNTFPTFVQAVYWATVSLTTVGYGDIVPVTSLGHIITAISSLLGIALVALPAAIITTGLLEELNERADALEEYEYILSHNLEEEDFDEDPDEGFEERDTPYETDDGYVNVDDYDSTTDDGRWDGYDVVG